MRASGERLVLGSMGRSDPGNYIHIHESGEGRSALEMERGRVREMTPGAGMASGVPGNPAD